MAKIPENKPPFAGETVIKKLMKDSDNYRASFLLQNVSVFLIDIIKDRK